MNDRFKFRVWYMPEYDKPRMIYGAEKTYDFMYGEPEIICADCFGSLLDSKEYRLMQCTGLKDKNGKLIYEGDIVKYKDEVYGLCIGKIEWDNAHYEFQYYTGEKYGWFSHILCLKHIKNIEVIGNIYENKELLGEE